MAGCHHVNVLKVQVGTVPAKFQGKLCATMSSEARIGFVVASIAPAVVCPRRYGDGLIVVVSCGVAVDSLGVALSRPSYSG